MKETLLKIVATILTIIVGFFPVGVYLLLDYLLSPVGFWQNMITVGVGLYFLCGLQIFLLIIMVKILLTIWED